MVRKIGLRFVRKKLRRGEREFKRSFPLLSQEARLGREIINTPRATRRFLAGNKALLDDPTQLRKKRIRPFLMVSMGVVGEVRIRRKPVRN